MGASVESAHNDMDGANTGFQLRMLGPLTILRDGIAQDLPSSRKVRGLLAYLATAPRAVGRSRLCEIMWDVPNDPRGELRWCLSKLRGILDEPDQPRVIATGDMISLDLSGCFVDVAEIAAASRQGLETCDAPRLSGLSELFAGDFLEGLEIDRSPHFQSWLLAQRRRCRAWETAVLEQLVSSLPEASGEISPYVEKWVELAPFDGRAHMALLGALARRGRIDACEEHLSVTARLFEAEDLDFGSVRAAWQTMRERQGGAPTPAAFASAADVAEATDGITSARRASLAVMPFLEQTDAGVIRGGLADGLTHDIITRLARLRDLFVIARGSVFALAERGIGPEDAGRWLNVDYVASGTVRRREGRILVTIELVEARNARIVWAENFDHELDTAFIILDEIGNRIVSSITSEIEIVERNRAILKPPNSLDAWEAYHRGLWHMYRFTRSENEQAQHFFSMAVRLDPTFARAHAGLSFTHWQNAFQHWADRQQEADLAFDSASQSLIVDDHNPAAHWAMGRALWLKGQHNESLDELTQAVNLSPNFALGHYALSFVHSQTGDPQAAIRSSDQSRHLSPFDPLLFGMLGARAMAHVRLGQFEEAADWGLKAAGRPNAHANIFAIAAHSLALAGRVEEGRAIAAHIRKSLPGYSVEDFLTSFQFAPDDAKLFRYSARQIRLD